MTEEKMINVEVEDGQEIEITEFPEQTTFNTEDMTITEGGE